MRYALCLSGHFRSYERAFPSLKSSILDEYQPDIFIHTLDTLGYDGADRGDHHLIKIPTNIDIIKKLYNPKKILIEPKKSWDTKKYIHRMGSGLRNPENINGMFYGIHIANFLKKEYEKENNFVYDVVIRGRADLLFDNKLSFQELENSSKKDGIYFPKFGSYNGLNDQFAFGNSINMDMYADTYPNLDNFFNLGCLWHAETMMKFTINHYNIPILRSDINFAILRANGHLFRLAREAHLGDIL